VRPRRGLPLPRLACERWHCQLLTPLPRRPAITEDIGALAVIGARIADTGAGHTIGAPIAIITIGRPIGVPIAIIIIAATGDGMGSDKLSGLTKERQRSSSRPTVV